jgi:uncharacterized Zn finger protein (UPF0148 family)
MIEPTCPDCGAYLTTYQGVILPCGRCGTIHSTHPLEYWRAKLEAQKKAALDPTTWPKPADEKTRNEQDDQYIGQYIWFEPFGGVTLGGDREIYVHRILRVSHDESPGGSDCLVYSIPHGGKYMNQIESYAMPGCPLPRTGKTPPLGRMLCPYCFPPTAKLIDPIDANDA